MTDSKTCVVGYTNGGLAQYDFHAEHMIQMVRASDTELGNDSRDAQINQVLDKGCAIAGGIRKAKSSHQCN